MLIFLLGFMGCGKSYTARKLSEKLDIPVMDMDKDIEEQEGRSVSRIFSESGEAYFRNLESDWLRSLDPESDAIISTGGGSPCFGDNMDVMKALGITIFLDTERERIIQRLAYGRNRRPLLEGMNELDIGFFYDEKMKERRPFYERSDFHLYHQDINVLANLILSFKRPD